jgi:hypothetical protein
VPEVSQQKALAACEIYYVVTTANITVNKMARQMEGKIVKYAGGGKLLEGAMDCEVYKASA